MATPSIEQARGWIGRDMVDRDDNSIGKVVDIYLDNESGRPEWAVVRTGLLGMRSSFVPLAEATEVDDEIQVPHAKTQVKEAPSIEPDGQLSAAEEAELYRHYGLDYDTVTLEDGAAAGHPSAGSAGQPQRSASDEPADAAGTSARESASTAGERLSDTDADVQPASASVGGEPVGAVGEGRLPVGEGVSRPFVYETPGGQDGAAGARRRQPGQVRLRRYLVTEVVTDTESGQRHELQVQREPVSDAEVDAITPATNQQGQPIGQEAAEPEPNDWFSDGSDPQR
jgi:PRC-barrel domain protein